MNIRFQGITVIGGMPQFALERANELTVKKYEFSLVSSSPAKPELYAITKEDMAELIKDSFNITVEPEIYNASPAEAKANPALMQKIDDCLKKTFSEVKKIGKNAFMEKVAQYVENRITKHDNKDAKGDEINQEFATIAGVIGYKKNK